jgi:flagellin
MTMQIGPTKGEVLDLKGQDMTLKGIFNDLDKVSSDGLTLDANKAGFTTGSKLTAAAGELKKLISDKTVDADQAGKDLTNAVRDAMNRADMKGAASVSVKVTANGTIEITGGSKISGTSTAVASVTNALKDAYDSLDGVQKSKGSTAEGLSDGKEYIQITSSGVDGDDVTANANRVVKNIQSAIDHVSSYRAELGAKQNRLEHTINNLQVTSENTTAAESRIRDTDMAKEMAAYTKNNILSQAAQSMLAQANQSGQGVLSLLQ